MKKRTWIRRIFCSLLLLVLPLLMMLSKPDESKEENK